MLGSMVVFLQMTLVLRGIVMSREVRPFVVDHLRSLSKDYLRLTPLWHALPRGAIVVRRVRVRASGGTRYYGYDEQTGAGP